MAALFGKKNFRQTFEKLLNENNVRGALSEAIRQGDEFYDLHEFDSAVEVYNTFLDMLIFRKISDYSIYEKIYEKLIPLYFDRGDAKKGIDLTFSLVNLKIKLEKISEAVRILKVFEKNFSTNKSVLLKIVEIYTSIRYFNDAFHVIDHLIEVEPKSAELVTLGGDLLFNMGKYEDALSYYTVLLDVAKDSSYALEKIQEINKILGRTKIEVASSAEETLKKKTELKQVVEALSKEEPSGGVIIEKEPSSFQKTEVEVKLGEIPLIKAPELPLEEILEKIKPEEKELAEVHEKKPKSEEIVPSFQKEISIIEAPKYVEAIEEMKMGNIEKGLGILNSLASTLESEDFRSAEFLYSKILLLQPENVEVAKKLSELYNQNKRIGESIFYLRVAAKNAKGLERVSLLRRLLSLNPNDLKVREELFNELLTEKRFEEVYEVFSSLNDEKIIEQYATKLLPVAHDDIGILTKVSKFLISKKIKSRILHDYSYLLGKLLYATDEKPEAVKWLLTAHRIEKLPLEDYVELAKYIIDLPLDEEKDIVANAIYSYLDSIEEKDKKIKLINLIMSLKPDKVVFIAKYLELLLEAKNYSAVPKAINAIVKGNATEYADLVYSATIKALEQIITNDLMMIGEYLEIAGRSEEAEKIYSIVLEKDPKNEIAVIKSFTKAVESESIDNILKFFDSFNPSYSYQRILNPLIEKIHEKQVKNPFDYHNYFLLGFLYFITERNEEAIAAFQFVTRSKHYEPLMYLFLGIAFERIKLPDFALKQYVSALKYQDISSDIKIEVLYRKALLHKSLGKKESFNKDIKEILSIDPNYKDMKSLLSEIAEENKIKRSGEEEEK